MYFFALSHAPPALDMKMAMSMPVATAPARKPPSMAGLKQPMATGTTMARQPGSIISRRAEEVEMATHLSYSGSALYSMMPLISRNWRRTSSTMAWAARDTAPMVSAANMNGIMAPMKIPATISGSVSVSAKSGMEWCIVAW